MTNDEELHPAAMLDYVLAYSPVILAVLAAQLVASTSSLRYWLAVCAIPESIPVEGPKPEVPPEKHQSWWWRILPIAAVAVVFGVTVALCNIYRAMGREFPELDGVLSVILFPVAIFVIISCFSICLVRPAISVHRNSAGALVNIPSKSSNSKTLSIYLFLSIAIYIGTFIAERDVFIIFTIFASIVMCSRWSRGYNSLIPFGIAFICCIVAFTTVTVLLLFSDGAKSWIDPRKSTNSYINQSLKRVLVYAYWTNAIAWSSLSASFTSFCLRFDYHIHLEHSENRSMENFAVDKVPPPLSVPGVGPGAVVPSCIPTKFSKPYFFTSILTFVFAAAATLACLPFLGVFLDRLPANIFVTVMIGAVFPLQYIAVIRMAKLRGEWQILSQYKEEWIRKPIPSKAVIDLEECSGGKVGSDLTMNINGDPSNEN